MKLDKKTLITIAAVVSVIFLIVVGITSVTGNAIAYEEKVTEAQSAISVQEKKRATLFPELVDCVKAYDRHEYETLLEIVNARSSDGMITDEMVNEVKANIKLVLEDYPELSSQPNYERLMRDISITENEIANTRDAYNKTVSRYNTYTRHPLRKFFLSLTGYERIEFQKLSYDVSDDNLINLFDER